MSEYITIIRDFFSEIHPLFILLFIYIVGLYIFWRTTIESRKNRSSVFDMFIFSGFLSVVAGRVAYIVIEWQQFAQYIWYWLPYEKYGEKIFLFRLLPWRFFSIWDGEMMILAMFVSLILFTTFLTLVIKRWRWKHMFFPIYFSAVVMLGLSFLFTGFGEDVNDWVFKGLALTGSFVVFAAIYTYFSAIIPNPVTRRLAIGYAGLVLIWLSSGYIGYIYLTSSLSILENILVGVFLVWSVLAGIFFILDLRRATVSIERLSNVRSVGQVGVRI